MTGTKEFDSNKAQEEIKEASSPMQALAAAYNNAPHKIVRSMIDGRALEVLATDIPMLQELIVHGPAVSTNDIQPLVTTFTKSIEALEESAPDAVPNATAREYGLQIAETIDKARTALLREDSKANRQANLELVKHHAAIIAALDSLALTEEQQALVEKNENSETTR